MESHPGGTAVITNPNKKDVVVVKVEVPIGKEQTKSKDIAT